MLGLVDFFNKSNLQKDFTHIHINIIIIKLMQEKLRKSVREIKEALYLKKGCKLLFITRGVIVDISFGRGNISRELFDF